MDDDPWEIFENVFSDTIYETSSEVHSLCCNDLYICAGLRSGLIWVLDISSSSQFYLKSSTSIVNSLSLYSTTLISAGQDSLISIWDLPSQLKKEQIQAHEGVITSFDIVYPFIFSSSVDQTLKQFDLVSLSKISEMKVDTVICCIKAYDSKLYLGCEDGSIEVRSLDLSKISNFEGHLDAVWCIDCFCDLVISSSFDGTIRVWDSSNGSSQVIGEHSGVVNKIGIFDPSNCGIPLIVSVGSDKVVRLWALDGLKDEWKFHKDCVAAVVVLDMFVVTAGFDKKIRMWSLMNHLKTKVIHSAQVQDFELNQDKILTLEKGKISDFNARCDVKCFALDLETELLVVGLDEKIEFFQLNSFEKTQEIGLGAEPVRIVLKNRKILVSCGSSLFFIKSGIPEQINEESTSGDFSDEYIVTSSSLIKLLDHNYSVLSTSQEKVNSVLISRNTSFLYTSTNQGIKLFALASLTPLCEISIYEPISKLKLHPVSSILALTSSSILYLPEYDKEKEIMLS